MGKVLDNEGRFWLSSWAEEDQPQPEPEPSDVMEVDHGAILEPRRRARARAWVAGGFQMPGGDEEESDITSNVGDTEPEGTRGASAQTKRT